MKNRSDGQDIIDLGLGIDTNMLNIKWVSV